jgi:hypothetical protein
MFKAWKREWGDDEARIRAWAAIAQLVTRNNASVLMGTEVTCSETEDDQTWKWSLEFMRYLGAKHILAMALGNEMELYFNKGVPADCITKLWSGGRYFGTVVKRVEEMDRDPDFRSVRVTSVFGAYSFAGWPFVNTPVSQVQTYLTNAWKKYGKRWVWSFNLYPFWDQRCGAGWNGVTSGARGFRQRITAITKSTKDTFWMSETGWSSAPPSNFHDPCPGYCSLGRMRSYYESFLRWRLLDPADGNVDRAFYFTMRDSVNFKMRESFGLVATCQDTACKLQAAEAEIMI